MPEPSARVVLLVGPSGCGKTYLARQAGLPIVALDDFYRSDDDPEAPHGADGLVDWEDPRSWDRDAALGALETVCRTGAAEVPDYSFAQNRAVGSKVVSTDGSCLVVAEGIFAAEIIADLRDRGLLAGALLIRRNRWATYARRLLRDAREGRKDLWYLVRQGWMKTRAEPAVVARQQSLGAEPVTLAQARTRLGDLVDASA